MPLPAPDFDQTPARERKRIYHAVRLSILTCWHCGHAFIAARTDARYCSNACRQAAYRARHR